MACKMIHITNCCLFCKRILILIALFLIVCSNGQTADAEEREKEQHKIDALTILLYLFLLILVVLTIWLFKHRRFRFVHETGLAIVYGLVVGAIIRYSGNFNKSSLKTNGSKNQTLSTGEGDSNIETNVSFNNEIFWNVFLPLIIFNAGYSMKRKHFFRNIGAVMAYAFLGTTISCFVVGAIMYGVTRANYLRSVFNLTDCFYFGALISATDPVTVLAIFSDLNVDVDLYALIFGESVLNDAVAIVLTRSIKKYGSSSGSTNFDAGAFFTAIGIFFGVMLGAFIVGAVIGCITAILTKFTKIRDFPVLETALFCLVSMCAFEIAEATNLSGIVAVLFCGITQAHYTFNNLSLESQSKTKQLFEILNFLSENFVFLYIGVSVFTVENQKWDAVFIFAAFLAIIVGRLLNIYPLSFILNLFRKDKISFKFQNMMMFAGLRGAIAFALSAKKTNDNSEPYILSTTMVIVLTTVILCGGFTTPMLQWLQIQVGVDDTQGRPTDVRGISRQTSTTTPSSGTKDKAWLAAKWYNFDRFFMKPLLTNSRPTLIDTLPNCCLPLSRILTTGEQLADVHRNPDVDSDTDIILDNDELSANLSNQFDTPITTPDTNHVRIQDLKIEIQEAIDSDCGDDTPLITP